MKTAIKMVRFGIESQNFDPFLENKVHAQKCYQNMSIIKVILFILYFSLKIGKIWQIFDVEKLL